ncbi:MAG TPA: cupin domain-containing protein [Thermodesulfobacteriota bacterium]|jgi:mannose-6-phosphate isomerase-like protein (cupin superfamily)|nr:cupin domain-containing protein [Thermodesulfobacteriota bacterium]
MPKHLVRSVENAPEVIHSLCGESRRVITHRDTPEINIHITHILDGVKHYHKRTTEVYYVLEGKGKLELDDETVDVKPGVTVLIPPGVRHRGYGDFRTIVIGTPAQTSDDEYTD